MTASAFDKYVIDVFRRLLVEQQRLLFDEVEGVEAELRVIEEDVESELEERAQDEAAASLLAILDERGQSELREIHDALARIRDGAYGVCTECEEPIPMTRLEVMPSAALCVPCMSAKEARIQRAGGRFAEPAAEAGPALPPAQQSLEDGELVELLRERFKDAGVDAFQGVLIRCSNGIVTLAGELPSDELRQVAVQIIVDQMGLGVRDRLRITELSEAGAAVEMRSELPDDVTQQVQSVAEAASEDVFEAEETGLPYRTPSEPVPEKE